MSEPPLPSARRQLLLAKYGPSFITPFYFGFSTHVLSPTSFSKFVYYFFLCYQLKIILIIFVTRLFGPRLELPLANTLWLGSHIGTSLYLYTSKHLRSASPFERLLYR